MDMRPVRHERITSYVDLSTVMLTGWSDNSRNASINSLEVIATTPSSSTVSTRISEIMVAVTDSFPSLRLKRK